MNKKIDDQVKALLDEFSVDFPSEAAISQTISELHCYLPKQKKPFFNPPFFKELLALAGQELIYVSPLFWVLNLVFLGVGVGITLVNHLDPYWTLFILTPMPFLTGLFEVFKSRESGMVELESTCKYSSQQVMLARLLLIGTFNVVLNVIMVGLFVSAESMHLSLVRLLTYWGLPFTTTSAAGLVLTTQVKHVLVSPLTATMWFVFSFLISKIRNGTDILNGITLGADCVIIALSLILIVFIIKSIKGRAIFDFEN